MNEQRIQQIVELEKQAQGVYEAAVSEAEQLPIQAKKESQAIVEQAQAKAQAEARRLVAVVKAQAEKEKARILEQAQQDAERMRALAMGRFDRAVGFILNRVTGRE